MKRGKKSTLESPHEHERSFTVQLDKYNNAFGISADTLRHLAAGYNVSPEAVLVRAVTMWAQAAIPDLNLDEPTLLPEQIKMLEQLKTNTTLNPVEQHTSLAQAFKSIYEGKGIQDENAKHIPRNGGHT